MCFALVPPPCGWLCLSSRVTFHETEPAPHQETKKLTCPRKRGHCKRKVYSLPTSNHYFFRTHVSLEGNILTHLSIVFSHKLPNGSCAFPRTDGRQPNQRLTPALPQIQLRQAKSTGVRKLQTKISQELDL